MAITRNGSQPAAADVTATGTQTLENKTLGTGSTWNGNAVTEVYGGTNQTSYTTGDILYASGSNTLGKLGVGSEGQTLVVSSGVPAWGAASSGVSANDQAFAFAVQVFA